MKIRNGFVSNSSSSSFILSANQGVHIKGTIEVKLDDIVEFTIRTQEEAESYIRKFRYYGRDELFNLKEVLKDDKYTKDAYDEIMEEINNKKVVYVCSVSSEDEGISGAIYSGADVIFNNGIKVKWDM